MTEQQEQIRLLDLTYLDGPRQMAISEAILEAVGKGIAPATIRLYSWSEPVVVLGVGQRASDLDLERIQERGYRVLRRIGGGTAVYHDANEISVDLIVPAGSRLGPSDVHAGYRQFATVLSQALADLGIKTETVSVEMARSVETDDIMRPFCFGAISPYEFLHDNRKLDGICQIRRRDAIAYQVAIYNRFDPEPLVSSVKHDDVAMRDRRRTAIMEFVTDMERARGEPVDYAELQTAIVNAVEKHLDAVVREGSLTQYENEATERLIREKYANDEWTFRR